MGKVHYQIMNNVFYIIFTSNPVKFLKNLNMSQGNKMFMSSLFGFYSKNVT